MNRRAEAICRHLLSSPPPSSSSPTPSPTTKKEKEKEKQKEVVVVGGVVLDVVCSPSEKFLPRTSNPGEIKMSWGGVGRNIAEGIHRLGLPTRLISAVGSDRAGSDFLHSHSPSPPPSSPSSSSSSSSPPFLLSVKQLPSPMRTATYVSNHNQTGEMIVAYADMDIFSHLTPSLLLSPPLPPLLSSARVVVLDSNLSKESIFEIAKYCGEKGRETREEREGERVDVWVESVSISKCVRVIEGGGVKWANFISGNEEEVMEMGRRLGEGGGGEGREGVIEGLMEGVRGEVVGGGWRGGRGEWERRVGVLEGVYGGGVVGELVREQEKGQEEVLKKIREVLPFALKVLENGGQYRQTTTKPTLKAIFITLGKSGAFVLTNPSSPSSLLPPSPSSSSPSSLPYQIFYHPSLPVSNIVNVSGAGDSFISGVISSLSVGSSLSFSLFYGALSASLSLQSETPISPSLNNISFHK